MKNMGWSEILKVNVFAQANHFSLRVLFFKSLKIRVGRRTVERRLYIIISGHKTQAKLMQGVETSSFLASSVGEEMETSTYLTDRAADLLVGFNGGGPDVLRAKVDWRHFISCRF